MHKSPSNLKKSRLRSAILKASPAAVKFLTALLFLLTIEFVWFAFAFYIDVKSDPVKALSFYSPVFEHLMMSLMISIGSAITLDLLISKDTESKK